MQGAAPDRVVNPVQGIQITLKAAEKSPENDTDRGNTRPGYGSIRSQSLSGQGILQAALKPDGLPRHPQDDFADVGAAFHAGVRRRGVFQREFLIHHRGHATCAQQRPDLCA